MKKITTFVSLVLLSFLGASLAWATLVPSSDPEETRLETVKDGDQFFIRCALTSGVTNWDDDRWLSLLTPYASGQETLVTIVADRSKIYDEGLFMAEATGSQLQISTEESLEGFFLKNVKTGMYVYSATESDGMACYMGLTADKEKATVWGFRPTSEVTDDEEAAGKFFIVTVTSEGKVWCINAGNRGETAGGHPIAFYGTWINADGWYDLIPAEEGEEDPIEKHANLYAQAAAYGMMDDEGHYVIYGGVGGYADDLVKEYNAVMYENTDDLLLKEYIGETVDWDTIVSQLEALIIHMQTAELRDPEDGYYYIVSAYTPWTYEGEERAVYAYERTVYWSTFESNEEDPAYMWHIVKKDSAGYILQNVAEGALFTQCVLSGEATLSGDDAFRVQFHQLGNGQFNIQVGDNGTDNYVHPKGHNSGSGTEGTICGFSGGVNSQSAWRLIPIDEALYEPYIEEMEQKFAVAKDELVKEKQIKEVQDSLIKRVKEICDVAKPAFEYELPDDVIDVTPLSYEDFESNAGMLDGAPEDEKHGYSWGNDGQGFGALIDDDIDTYFHTCWTSSASNIKWSAYNEDGTPAEGAYETTLHNLGMKLSQPASNVTFQVAARHSAYYNNPTKINVEVSHDGINWSTVYYGYDFFTPSTDAEIPYLMGPFELGDRYEYVRFANHINDREGRRFFVFSELKVFVGAKLTATCQASTMDQTIISNFLQAYSNANKYADIVTIEQLDEIEAALDQLEAAFAAFKGAFADPSELLAAISKADAIVKNYKTGTDMLGLYDGSVSIDDLATEVDNARDLLDAGFYKQDAVNQATAQINNLIAEIEATVIKPDPNKWYQFVFPSQEEFEANPDWLRSQAEINVGETGDMSLALYDRVAAITAGTDSTFYDSVEELRESQNLTLRSVHDWQISDQIEVSHFRFIPLEDGKYVIQNRATGLFINDIGQGAVAELTSAADWIGAFDIEYLGQGCCLLHVSDYVTEEDNNLTLHFTWNTNNAVTAWTDQTIGTKSSIHVLEVGSVDEDLIMRRDAEEDQAITIALPTNVTEIEGGTAYSIAGLFLDESDEENPQMFIGLKPITKANGDQLKPGQPAIIIADDETIDFTLGNTLTKEILTENSLHGTGSSISSLAAGEAVLRFNAEEGENYFQVIGGIYQYGVNASSAYLSINSADELPTFDSLKACEIWIPVRGNLKNTGIKTLTLPFSLSGNVYDLSGKRVGTSRELNKLSRGIYVVNGHKILIP